MLWDDVEDDAAAWFFYCQWAGAVGQDFVLPEPEPCGICGCADDECPHLDTLERDLRLAADEDKHVH
jgi:hypothetical protein